MDESAEAQLGVIHRVVGVMRGADISAWLFGGWGLDARIGRITRDHGDVEFWIERHQYQRSKAMPVEAGAITIRGRWSDWEFPLGSFGDDPGIPEGVAVPAMSAAGMLAMKQQFPTLRNGRPWREKDRHDIEVLRALIEHGAGSQ